MLLHGLSHLLAMILCFLGAGWLIQFTATSAPKMLGQAMKAAAGVQKALSLSTPPLVILVLALAAILAFVWGALFALLHRDRR